MRGVCHSDGVKRDAEKCVHRKRDTYSHKKKLLINSEEYDAGYTCHAGYGCE